MKLTGRFQRTATAKRNTIDEYRIAGWSFLGSSGTSCKGGATGRLLIIPGGEEGDRDKELGGNVEARWVDEGLGGGDWG